MHSVANSDTVTSIATYSKNGDDNLCYICKCDFEYYIDKKEWIQCVSCSKWVCGRCNKGSKKRQYECERCECMLN